MEILERKESPINTYIGRWFLKGKRQGLLGTQEGKKLDKNTEKKGE